MNIQTKPKNYSWRKIIFQIILILFFFLIYWLTRNALEYAWTNFPLKSILHIILRWTIKFKFNFFLNISHALRWAIAQDHNFHWAYYARFYLPTLVGQKINQLSTKSVSDDKKVTIYIFRRKRYQCEISHE